MVPKVFIASSRESLDWAAFIMTKLNEHEMTADSWDLQSLFRPSEYFLDSFLEKIAEYDFGVFFFSPDDTLVKRGRESKSVRDNVLFELGIFIGQLGRKRNFVFRPNMEDFHWLSDLNGLLNIQYSYKQQADPITISRELTGPCRTVIHRIKEIGIRSKQTAMVTALQGDYIKYLGVDSDTAKTTVSDLHN